MAQQVTTPHGPGTVVESDTVRGRTSYRVEGDFGSIWMEAASIPEFGQVSWDSSEPVIQDNSTILPYNPTPQHYVNTGESTIQPNQSIDSDKRLHPSDSVTHQERNRPGPGPAPHLFAGRTAAVSMDELSPEMQKTVEFVHGHAYDWALNQTGDDPDVAEDYAAWCARYTMKIEEMPEYGHESMWQDYVSEMHGGNDPRYASRNSDLQERLGGKYVDLPDLDVDRGSIQARLDDDPYRVISELRIERYEVRPPLDEKIGKALDLEDANPGIRTAAWADVRAKATRIRQSGGVQLEAANPTAIVATVTGDHGIYTVAVLRGNALTGSSAVTEWSCTCPWGDWAFERQHTFVGRLCSHAYASLQELRSLNMRKEKPRDWSNKASAVEAIHAVPNFSSMTDDEVIDLYDSFPEHVEDPEEVDRFEEVEAEMVRRDLWGRNYQSARHETDNGELSLVPGTLTPDLNHIPQTHERRRVDLEASVNDREAGWGDAIQCPLCGERDSFVAKNSAGWGSCDSCGSVITSPGVEQDLRDNGWNYDGDRWRHTPLSFLSEPFEGSGADQKDSMGSSVDYLMEHETPYVDIEEDTGNPVEPNGDDVMPRTSAVQGEDPLAYLLTGSNEGSGGNDDLAGAAEAFLRTAGRSFSMQEQQDLIDEDAVGGTISTADLDLRGTHYLP